MNSLITKRCSPIEEAIYQQGFQAGAAGRDAEIARLKAIPVQYRRLAFNAQLQDEIAELEQENDKLRAKVKQKDAEIAELVAALEHSVLYVPDLATVPGIAAALAKVRKP